jgi:hypothetical protein
MKNEIVFLTFIHNISSPHRKYNLMSTKITVFSMKSCHRDNVLMDYMTQLLYKRNKNSHKLNT